MTKAIVKHLYKELNGSLVTKSCPTLAAPWTVAHWALLSMRFSRQEYWSGLPCPPPGDFPDPEIEPTSPVVPALQAVSLPLGHQGSPQRAIVKAKSHCTSVPNI